MSLKKFTAVVLVTITTGSMAWGDCSTKDAQAAVEKACSQIEASGEKALAEINTFRYCGDNYVWIQDSNVKMVLHPIKPRLNGTSLETNVDEKGLKLFVKFDEKAKSNADGGWVDYLWAKPGQEKATAKTSFVKKCKGSLGYIAGSGIWK